MMRCDESLYRLTLAIPIYNVEAYLPETLRSVLAQDLTDCEVLLIDDGSTDRSGEIADACAQNVSNIRVIHTENRGVSAARNTAIREARGQYVYVLDSDDTLDAAFVRTVWPYLDGTLDVLQFSYTRVDPKTGRVSPKNKVPKACCAVLSGWAFSRNLLNSSAANGFVWLRVCRTAFLREKSLYFVEGLIHEDSEWCIRLGLSAGKIRGIPDRLYFYYRRPASLTQRANPKRGVDYMRGNALNIDFLAQRQINDPALIRAVHAYCFKHWFKGFWKLVRLGVLNQAPYADELRRYGRVRFCAVTWVQKCQALLAGMLVRFSDTERVPPK